MPENARNARAEAHGPVDGDDRVTFTVLKGYRMRPLWLVAIIGGLQILLFAGLGLHEGRFPWEAALAMSVSFLAALGVAWWLMRAIFDPRRLKLVVGREGIHAPIMADSLIPWSAIEAMSIEPYLPFLYPRFFGRGLVLRLTVSDSGRFRPRPANFLWRLAQWRFGGDLLFPVSGLTRPAEDVADAIAHFAPRDLMAISRLGGRG